MNPPQRHVFQDVFQAWFEPISAPRHLELQAMPETLLQVVLKLIQPYTRIRIPFVSKQLNIPETEVEQLLVSLILDGRIRGYLDQVPSGTL